MDEKRISENASFGELFSSTFNEFTSKFSVIGKNFLFCYLIPMVILIVIVVLILIITFPFISISGNSILDLANGAPGLFFGQSDLPITGVALILIFVFFGLVSVILTLILNINYINIGLSEDSEITFSEVFSKTKQLFWRYIGLVIVSGIFLLGLFLLFIVPGVIFLVYWVFATYILIDQDKRILESLKESKRIVKGRWWRVFGFVLLLALIIAVVSLVAGLIPIVGSIVGPLITTPFAILFMKNFYLDMKENIREI